MANEKTFDAIFNDLVVEIKSKSDNIWDGERGEEFSKFLCNKLLALRTDIEEEYTYRNKRIKREFMEDRNGLLDRHKCAAVFMISFLNRFELTPAEEESVKNIVGVNLIKERLAGVLGLSIIVTMISEELEDWKEKKASGQITTDEDERKYEGCKETVDYLRSNHNNVTFPGVICDTKQYPYNWILELYYAKKENRLFVLSLANELFCIERYNRQLAEINRLKTMLRNIAKI
jgi:hypothetical protein